jgi:hypothetical protein
MGYPGYPPGNIFATHAGIARRLTSLGTVLLPDPAAYPGRPDEGFLPYRDPPANARLFGIAPTWTVRSRARSEFYLVQISL